MSLNTYVGNNYESWYQAPLTLEASHAAEKENPDESRNPQERNPART